MTVPETFPSKLLEDAVQAIGSLPGVGKRSALRLALHLLRQPSENVHHFADSIVKMRDEEVLPAVLDDFRRGHLSDLRRQVP